MKKFSKSLLSYGILAAVLMFAVLGAPFAQAFDTDEAELEGKLADLPMTMPNFRLQDVEGNWHELDDYAGKKAIVLFVQGNGCPIVRQSIPYFEQLIDEYESEGVAFLYWNASDYDMPEDVQTEAAEYNVTPPILKDWGQALTRELDVERTAECFLVDHETKRIVYRGMADDRFEYGLQRANPQKFWLQEALDAFLNGNEPKVTKTIAKGCLVDTYLPEGATWQGDVAPILNKHFDAGPGAAKDGTWAAVPESETQELAPKLREAILMRHNPTAPDTAPIDFTADEIKQILAWFQQGMPYGG